MASNVQPKPKKSMFEQALKIYREHLQQAQDGTHDRTMTWRQAVLSDIKSQLHASDTNQHNLYLKCQHEVGLKANKKFEVVRLDGTQTSAKAANTKTNTKNQGSSRPAGVASTPTEPIVVAQLETQHSNQAKPVHQPIAAPTSNGTSTSQPLAATVAAALTPASTPAQTTGSSAKKAAMAVHKDLIAYCDFEIGEAFKTLEELMDNVDQLGDASTLKKFTRQMRAACKRIDLQLTTKAVMDKTQAKKILPGLAD
ncbi:hypothetical protein ACWA7J_06030 [Leptothrix sp. BB-4]